MTQVVRTFFARYPTKFGFTCVHQVASAPSAASPRRADLPAPVLCGAISLGRIVMFTNLKIKTKMLAVILFLGIISFAGLLYIVSEFRRADQAYSAFLDNEAVAATKGTRSSTSVLTSVLQASM